MKWLKLNKEARPCVSRRRQIKGTFRAWIRREGRLTKRRYMMSWEGECVGDANGPVLVQGRLSISASECERECMLSHFVMFSCVFV